jgi:hypothetical protein
MSRIAPAIQATPFTITTYRFDERFDIDTIGPLPKDDCENEYVVVMKRFDKLTPVKSTSGLDAARALIDFVGTFACMRIIHSDQGTQFLNDMVTSLVTEGFSAFQRVTTASSKEENAIVKRANKEVNRHLRAFVFDIASSVQWLFGSFLPSWYFHRMPTWTEGYYSIGQRPMNRRRPVAATSARTNTFVAELFRIHAQVLETALAVQLAQDAQHLAARQAAQIADLVEIREGDYVLLVPKIPIPRKGPFEVTQRVNANTYRIRDLVSQRDSKVNVSLLVPYHLHPLFATPLTVSEHEQEEWAVESVVDHEPHVIPRDRRHWRF